MEEAAFFAGSPLTRLAEKRSDAKFILSILREKGTFFLPFDGLNPFAVVAVNENGPSNLELLALDLDSISKCFQCSDTYRKGGLSCDTEMDIEMIYKDGNAILLGEKEENGSKQRYFAINVDKCQRHMEKCAFSGKEIRVLSSRYDIMNLSELDASLVSQSRSLIDWNQRNMFCPTCGFKTVSEDSGYKRTCTNMECSSLKGVHNTCYPRTDPVVISAVSSPDKQCILLGRKRAFPPNMFSCLAGFMEPGESVEEAVRREVKEESGVTVGPVKYVASQPWPYPSGIMIGCVSEAEDEEITVCAEELEDARWFTRTDIEEAFTGLACRLSLPPKQTIARRLIESWYQSTRGSRL